MLPKSGNHFSDEHHAHLLKIDHVQAFRSARSKRIVI